MVSGAAARKAKAAALILLVCTAEAVRNVDMMQASSNQTGALDPVKWVARAGMLAKQRDAVLDVPWSPRAGVLANKLAGAGAGMSPPAGVLANKLAPVVWAGMLGKPAVSVVAGVVTMGSKATFSIKLAYRLIRLEYRILRTARRISYKLHQLRHTINMIPSMVDNMITTGGSQLIDRLMTLKIDYRVALAGAVVLLVGAGAFKLWQQRQKTIKFTKAFCPTSSWMTNPTPLVTEPEESEDANISGDAAVAIRGMNQCNNLRPQESPVKCRLGGDDEIGCRMAACRQACCNKEHCTMFQFELKDLDDDEGVTHEGRFHCWLGEAKDFSPGNCNVWKGFSWFQPAEEDSRLSSPLMGLSWLQVDGNETRARPLSQQCADACARLHDCLFFQFAVGDDGQGTGLCYYGTEDIIEYDLRQPARFYGGVLDSSVQNKQGCPQGQKQCPASGRGSHSSCVDDCGSCEGFSVEDDEDEEEPKCIRSANQAVCSSDRWVDTFKEKSLSGYRCKGLKRQKVVMSEDTDFNAHVVCREMCCGDPTCILYQVRRDLANQSGLKEGQAVYCWLGKHFADSQPTFECERRVPEDGLFSRKWVGGYLEERGCRDGFSCLTAGECVESCIAQCPGAPLTKDGLDGRSCVEDDTKLGAELEAEAEAEETVVDRAQPNTHYLFYEEQPLTRQQEIAAAETLLMMKQTRERLITPQSISEDDCEAMSAKTGGHCERDPMTNGEGWAGCKCFYESGEKPRDCDTWFAGLYQLYPVIGESGMILISSEHCACDEQERTCRFGIMDHIPPIKVSRRDDMAVNL